MQPRGGESYPRFAHKSGQPDDDDIHGDAVVREFSKNGRRGCVRIEVSSSRLSVLRLRDNFPRLPDDKSTNRCPDHQVEVSIPRQ